MEDCGNGGIGLPKSAKNCQKWQKTAKKDKKNVEQCQKVPSIVKECQKWTNKFQNGPKSAKKCLKVPKKSV